MKRRYAPAMRGWITGYTLKDDGSLYEVCTSSDVNRAALLTDDEWKRIVDSGLTAPLRPRRRTYGPFDR